MYPPSSLFALLAWQAESETKKVADTLGKFAFKYTGMVKSVVSVPNKETAWKQFQLSANGNGTLPVPNEMERKISVDSASSVRILVLETLISWRLIIFLVGEF